jgi:hypothetical protein
MTAVKGLPFTQVTTTHPHCTAHCPAHCTAHRTAHCSAFSALVLSNVGDVWWSNRATLHVTARQVQLVLHCICDVAKHTQAAHCTVLHTVLYTVLHTVLLAAGALPPTTGACKCITCWLVHDVCYKTQSLTGSVCVCVPQGVTVFKDRIASYDDPLVQRLEEQGAIIVGEGTSVLVAPSYRNSQHMCTCRASAALPYPDCVQVGAILPP